jgi:hypothetical protein
MASVANSNAFVSLDALCTSFITVPSLEQIEVELSPLLLQGEVKKAKILLSSSEMKYGPWLHGGGSTGDVPPAVFHAKSSLAACHLLVLLCQTEEEDLTAAKLLTKRLGSANPDPNTYPYVLQKCLLIYGKLWNGDVISAIEVASQLKQDPQFSQQGQNLPMKALDQFIASIRNRQLQLLQQAYSAISVEAFGKALGLNSMAEVEAFCKWSPNVFQVREGYVHPTPAKIVNNEDVGAHIEKLTKLIVFLEGETVTFINSKISSAPGAVGGSSQQ